MTNPKPPPELLGAPPGTIPNLVNPVNQTEFFIVLHSICLVIITLGLAMRLYTRKFIVKRLKVDDYLCVFAYLLTVAGTGVNLLATLEGNGTHIWDLDWEGDQLKRIFRPFSIGIWIYIITVAVIKLACLSFYRNIFMSIRRTLMFVNIGIVAVLVLYTVMLFAQIFQCIPVALSWDNTIDGYCTKVHFVTYYSGFVNTFSDIYVLMVPIPAVWALPLAPIQKLRVLSVFALGLIATTMSIVRLGMFFRLYNGSRDATWEFAKVDVWSALEVHCGLLCACFLVFPAFIKRHWPRKLTSFFSNVLHNKIRDEESPVTAREPRSSRKYISHVEWSRRNRSDEVILTLGSQTSEEFRENTATLPPVVFNATRPLDDLEEPSLSLSTCPSADLVVRTLPPLFGGNEEHKDQEKNYTKWGGPIGGGFYIEGNPDGCGPMGGGPMGGM